MGLGKWIGGWLGWIMSQSILGAMVGYALGSMFDSLFGGEDVRVEDDSSSSYGGWQQTDSYENQRAAEGDRNSFLFSLMVLAAHIIQADGKIMHSEMEHVRQFLRQSFGETAVEQGDSILKKLFEYRKEKGEYVWQQQIQQACQEMSRQMQHEHRLQLMAFLCEIAKADGNLADVELKALRQLAVNLSLSADVVDQMLHLGGQTIEDAYAVLGITKDATDDEVRKAYRKMALQYHPDRVNTLGEDVKAAAQKKFQEINNAKEIIFKARNMK